MAKKLWAVPVREIVEEGVEEPDVLGIIYRWNTGAEETVWLPMVFGNPEARLTTREIDQVQS
jgi:hypothetical protein